MDGREAEITVDLVLQARAKVCDNKVNGPEDAVVSELIKQLPFKKIYIYILKKKTYIYILLRGASKNVSWVRWRLQVRGRLKVVFLRKFDAEPKKGHRSHRTIALTSVMSKWFASCIILRLEQEREPEKWKKLHVGGVNGISCQHLQVMAANLLQKHWEWQEEDRTPMLRHGNAVRPTMYLASMDIKTAPFARNVGA